MSGNNSFNKSMNGIVSLDTGGSTIEGDTITTDTINCQTINATTANLIPTINTSQIFTDFIASAANPSISILGDVSVSNSLKTRRMDSNTPSDTFLLLTDHTGIINIGSDASFIRFGSVTAPPRTAYVPVNGQDICNKNYVDSAVSGGSLLSTTNIWTGASNTFNNILNVSTCLQLLYLV
jgi:hypothetical protein